MKKMMKRMKKLGRRGGKMPQLGDLASLQGIDPSQLKKGRKR